MPSPYKEIPITFEKGLVTEISESLLDVGQASELENWEPLPNGALRSRNRYTAITTTGLTAPYNVRGFGAIATGTAVAGAVNAPVVVQTSVWPNGDADPVNSKTITLTGVNIGNVLIAIVTDDSDLTPSVSGGWTERAISTGDRQHVRFYTKTAASSTEAFTYTITSSRIRSVTVHEVKYLDSEDPGTKWAAVSKFVGSGGSDSLTVNATDTEGGIGFVGYLYDGGTPNTGNSGTSGWGGVAETNANTRTGVTFEDLDQLDGFNNYDPSQSTASYVSPSWTPPSTGIIIVRVNLATTATSSTPGTAITVSGNGLTWHDCGDAGELGWLGGISSYGLYGYAWADCSVGTPTTGSITVSIGNWGTAMFGIACGFVRAIGADTTDPFVQQIFEPTESLSGTPSTVPVFASALTDGSGVLGSAVQADADSTADTTPIPVVGVGDFQAQTDAFELTMGNVVLGAGGRQFVVHAHSSSSNSPDTLLRWTGGSSSWTATMCHYEIKGAGNAARTYKGTLTGAGSAVENFSYVADKEITGKMVVWGYTPPAVQPDVVDFYIVMAVAVSPTQYKVYRIPRDEITSGTWEQIDTVDDASSTEAFVSFAQGAGHLIWTASTMGYPRAVELATLSAFNIADMIGLAGRTAAYHKDRMFIAGSSQNPSRVYFSDIGNPLDFTTVTDFLDIGGDDGEAIQDLSSVEGLLLIPKTNRAYLVSGSGIESFFVNELAGGTAATGRSAIRTPYGTILAGDDDIWVVQGGGVDPMSRPLGSGYAISTLTSSAYAQDSVLICDAGTERVWRVNLVTGAWSIESVTGDDAGVYIVFSLNGRIYYGVDGSMVTVGGTRKLSDPRSYDANTGGTNFVAATGKLALLGPSVKYTPRWLFLQLRSHDTDFRNTLYVTFESDHGVTTKGVTVTDEVQRERVDIPKEHSGSEWIKITLRADSSAIAGAIDPERCVLGVDVEAPR